MRRVIWILILTLILVCSLYAQDSEDVVRTNPADLVPTITPNGGSFTEAQRVRISSSSGDIHYTLDGRNPTTSSTRYTDTITIDRNTTLSVRVFSDDGVASSVVTTEFSLKVATPTLKPTSGAFRQAQRVTVTTPASGAEIRYTTNGREPNNRSELYREPILIDGNTSLRIKAFKDGWNDSEEATGEFSFTVTDPTITPKGGSFQEVQRVVVRTATEGAQIRYTTDGTEPTTRSNLYSDHINVDRNMILKAKGFKDGWTSSQTNDAEFQFTIRKPSITPKGGRFTSAQNATLTVPVEGVQIRYTTDGSEPTERSSLYANQITIDRNMKLRVAAFRSGWKTSEIEEADFSFTVQRPSIELSSGSYNTPQSTSVSSETENSQIRYTMDGSEPTEASDYYARNISIDGNTNLKVKAFRQGWTPSETVSANYTFTVPDPEISPSGGDYSEPQNITITSDLAGVEIRYTTDGSQPSESSPTYTSTIRIDKTTEIRARAFRTGWTPSNTLSESYNLKVKKPLLTPPPGDFNFPQQVAITGETAGAKIHYTVDGSVPTGSSPQYTAPLDFDKQVQLRVKAFKDGWTDSEEVGGNYIFSVSRPAFFPKGGTYDLPQTVNISSLTEGAKIYFTDDGSVPTQNSTEFTQSIHISRNKTIRARAYSDGWESSQIVNEEYVIKTAMVFVPSGTFVPFGKSEPVRLTRSFNISRFPVTQEQWENVMEKNPSRYEAFYGNNHPVEWVSWYEVIKFCNLLSMSEGYRPVYSINGSTNPDVWGEVPIIPDSVWCSVEFNYSANGFRLPTSAEWEYAARSGGKDNYIYAGSDIVDEIAWHNANASGSTKPVGRKKPNSLGIYDMSGNVWEWCWDATDGGCNASGTDPCGNKGANRILRGGSFVSNAELSKISNVFSLRPHQGFPSRGFRLVRNAD